MCAVYVLQPGVLKKLESEYDVRTYYDVFTNGSIQQQLHIGRDINSRGGIYVGTSFASKASPHIVVNPRRACAARVTVVGSVCLSVSSHLWSDCSS